MRYRQCRSCSFWVGPADRFCANCGAFRPYQSGRAHRSAWLLFTTVLGGVLGGSVFYRSMDNAFLLYGCIAGCVTGLAWGLGLFGEVAAILLDRRRSPSLQSSELQLTERMAEIRCTQRQLRDLRRRLQAERESAARAFLAPLLQQADAAVERAARRYAGELAKLDLIRWRNGLQPITAPRSPAASRHEHHARLEAVHAHRERGRRLLRKWSGQRLAADEAGARLVKQLRRWLAACDRIVERLIAEQAQQALGRLAATELVPAPAAEIEREFSRLRDADADLAPDELEQVQYALDRLQAKEQLDRDLSPPP